MNTSLNKFYPEKTVLYYGYPAGEFETGETTGTDQNVQSFYNSVPPWIEELVSFRPAVCTEKNSSVSIVTFASSTQERLLKFLDDELGTDIVPSDQLLVLPSAITSLIQGRIRNTMIRANLKNIVPAGKLVMAQPYLEEDQRFLYQIPPNLTTKLNDKLALRELVDSKFLPELCRTYKSGMEFFTEDSNNIPIPSVIKISSSSSGDGVRVLRNKQDLVEAKQAFQLIDLPIFIEEYIDFVANLGIQFGISPVSGESIEILGVSKQLTSSQGEFLGGIIDKNTQIPFVLEEYLVKDLLPTIRNLGWYGVGGLDVLIDSAGRTFIVDPNFRLTAMTPFIFQMKNNLFCENKQVPFNGRFEGSLDELRAKIKPYAKRASREQVLNVIGLTEIKNEVGRVKAIGMNAAMLFDQQETLSENALMLQSLGIRAAALEVFRCSN